jgi:subtilisin family serine protease
MIFLAGSASADNESRLRAGGSPASIRLAGTEAAADISKVYIVQLRTPSAAEFHASTNARSVGAAKLAPGRLAPAATFDKSSAGVQSHVEKLVREQASVIAKAGANIKQIYSYQFVLNGFAAKMSPQQASKVEHMPEVLRIWEDEVRPLTTNFSADFLDLFAADVGLRGAPGLDGDGIIIGVIDSGIAPEHPALQDTREADRPQLCQGTWAEVSLLGRWLCSRYDKMDDVQDFDEDGDGLLSQVPTHPTSNQLP